MTQNTHRWAPWALVGVLLAGLGVRLHEIGYSLDGDESFSVRLASRPLAEVLAASLVDRPHPPLHNILLHGWLGVFGTSDTAARALSVLCAFLFLIVAYRILQRLLPQWLAIGVTGIPALSPFYVYYGQQSRTYALISLLAALNLLCFLRIIEAPADRKRILLWALSCAVYVHAQYLAVVYVGCLLVFALLYLPKLRWQVLAAGTLGLCTILPWLISAMRGPVAQGQDPLLQIAWMPPITLGSLVWNYGVLFGDSSLGDTLFKPARFVVLATLVILGAVYLRHIVRARKLEPMPALLIFLGIGMPVAIWILSVAGPKPVFAARQLLGAHFAFVCLIGLTLDAMRPRVGAAVVVAMLLWLVAAVPEGFPSNSKPPWRAVAQRIDSEPPGALAVAEEIWTEDPVEYYRAKGPVLEWSALSDAQKAGTLLLTCRRARCALADAADLAPRRTLLQTWTWGKGSGHSESNALRLYRFSAVADLPARVP